MKRVTIDPITRLEGHGKIEIFLSDDGEVDNVYLQIPELRGFEQFCVGRPAEEMPRITNRICGVCPEAHHMAATKALDALFHVEPSSSVRKLRELFYSAFYVTDHALHFYALGGPDFILGPEAPAAERNILGVIHKVGLETGQKVIECRRRNHHVIQMLGGRGIHPVAGMPGGWSKPMSATEREEIEAIARENVEFGLFSLQIFEKIVLENKEYVDLILSDGYTHRTYYMGTVDEDNSVNFYDGMIRVVSPDGSEFARYHPKDYAEHIAERVEPWSYLKFPYLKKVGWKGLTDGPNSGIYCATPLSRLNCADRMATPKAQEAFEKFYETLSSKQNGRYGPVHYRLATHWARLIELLYAAERMRELSRDPEITDPHVRVTLDSTPDEGVGSVEAPRGTLTHHYTTDANGILTHVNLIVGTTNNYAPISMSVKKAAESLIHSGTVVTDGLLNKVEMAFRNYDPCMSCATHSLPGQMPLQVIIRQADGSVLEELEQYVS